MLKWAVGQQQQQKRVETSTNCCRPPFRKSRRRSSGKENSNVESKNYESSPRNRDSVYMRLETIPAVLRDVSNYHQSNCGGASSSPSSRSSPTAAAASERRHSLKRLRTTSTRSPTEEPRKKQPCVDHHPGLCGVGSFESPPTSLYCFDQSLSPVELDHKEIPIRPEEREEILKTPITRRGFANRIDIAKRLWNSSNLSPLANQFNLLAVRGLPNSSPNVSELGDANGAANDSVLRNCLSMVNVAAGDEARTSQTNNDRNATVLADEERQSSSFAPSIDFDAPSCLRRQRALRRRRRPPRGGGLIVVDDDHNDDDNRSNAFIRKKFLTRSCLTLPDGIPSPFESPAVLSKLSSRRPIFVRSLSDVGESPPESLQTWDSHNMHFLKTPCLTDGHILNEANLTAEISPTSSKIESEDDVVSYGSVNLSDRSPSSVKEGQSKSRRCLTFTSPRVGTQRRSLNVKPVQVSGELELSIYYTSGMLTINVIRAKSLQLPVGTVPINAYIKVSMVPCASERTYHRTYVRRGSANPRFDTKFTFEVSEEDLERRVLVSAWHRDRGNRKSEFLGCMSFAVRHAVKRVISGWFRLLSQSSGRIKNVPTMTNSDTPWHQQSDVMANQSVSSVEELLSVDESDPAPEAEKDGRKKGSKRDLDKVLEDHTFLRHLELDPIDETSDVVKSGRTPFTVTKTLVRQEGSSYGFSIAWTHPPRVERVEAGLSADQAGLRPGDYVVFVGKTNVVTLQEEEILQLIKSFGSRVVLEIYRKTKLTTGGTVGTAAANLVGGGTLQSSNECSAATTTATAVSFDGGAAGVAVVPKRRLHLPQVTFTSEIAQPPTDEECRRRCVYQLLGKEQQYALCMQFGIARFMLPLAERRDLISSNEHSVLFQNAQELLRLTEDILELYVQEENLGQSLGRIYYKKMNSLISAYKRYCVGLKKADCLLVEKTRNAAFMKLVTEPPIPKRRPDLTTFIHKPLEHYREVLKLLQTTLSSTKLRDDDHLTLSRAIQDMQSTYREITIESGLMEPEGEGRPLLSVQDLESRLVFTRCKPFVLSSPGRQWIFGGDLSRVEGRSVRPFWALLFTDLLLFAKVSRDRVIFVTEEPLQLSNINQALFSIRKKATEFRLLISNSAPGEESPAVGGCADIQLTRNQKKGPRRRTLALRAPTPELKAVWQNLIQRQIIYINTARGGTPASSPMDSPDPLTAESLESLSTKHRQASQSVKTSTAVDLIEHRCRQLGKTGVSKGSALHLAQWMRGQFGGCGDGAGGSPESEPEVWSPDTLRRRAILHSRNGGGSTSTTTTTGRRTISRCEEIELSDVEQSTSDSQVEVKHKTVKSASEKLMAMCRKCHRTCLVNNKINNVVVQASGIGKSPLTTSMTPDINANQSSGFSDETNWESVQRGSGGGAPTTLSPSDPFLPVPHISVQPPTPTMSVVSGGGGGGGGELKCSPSGNNNFYSWERKRESDSSPDRLSGDVEEGIESEGDVEEPPYRSLSPCGLKRYGTVSSLEKLDDDDDSEDDTSREQDDIPSDSNHKPETVAQSIRGWTARAGTYVAEKISFFDRKPDEGRNISFIDRYLRSNVDSKLGEELIATSTILAGEDECETSGATSGEEVWGTPTSGDSGMTSPNNEFAESSLGTPFDDAREQLMFDRLLSGMSIMGSLVPLCPVTRGFPQRRRLDPLLEDEEDTSDTASVDNSDATKSYSTDQGNKSDTCAVKVSRSATSTPHRFLSRLKLRRSQSADSKTIKPNKFMEFLRGSKSEEHTSSSANRLTRLFSRESQDDIPTSLPPDFLQRKEHEKTTDRRFWKQLRKRKSTTTTTTTTTMSGGGDGGSETKSNSANT